MPLIDGYMDLWEQNFTELLLELGVLQVVYIH